MDRTSSPLLVAQMAQQQAQLGHVSLPTHPQPPQHVPKGRGRPRASYAQTGEFDLGLIREFRGRPALYDRANKRFKDKMHGAQLWMQISHKLGYDVSLLRERMITLRNRYNIEKRRVENSGIAISQWPLYDNLSFLSEHIRSRRTYKPQSREGDDDEEPYDVDNESQSNGHMKSIKHEFDPDFDEDDMDCDQPLPVTTLLTIPRNLDMANHQHNCNGSELVNGKSHPTSMLSTSLGCRQPELLVAKQKRMLPRLEEDPPAAKRTAVATTTTLAEATNTYPKFRAFGEFVSHSLNELPHAMSMRLVEKFTRELVQAAIASEQQQKQQQQQQQHQQQQQQLDKQQQQQQLLDKEQQQQQQQRDSIERSSLDELDD